MKLLLLICLIFVKPTHSFDCLDIDKKELKCTLRALTSFEKSTSLDDKKDVFISCQFRNLFIASYDSARSYFHLVCLYPTWESNTTCNYSVEDIIRNITSSIQNLNTSHNIFSSSKVDLNCNMQYPLISSNFSNATDLDLSGTNLKNLDENSFFNLKIVKVLKLTNNMMENISVGAFDHLTELQSLSLTNNRLTRLHERLFLNNKDLNNFMAQFNLLEELPGGLFHTLIHLKHVDLKNNKLTTLPANLFSKNLELTYLDVSHNLLSNLDYSVFPNAIDLQFLYLNNNKLKKIDLYLIEDPAILTWKEFTNLKNDSIDFIVRYLKEVNITVSIETLEKNRNDYLIKSNKLIYLDISHNEISAFPEKFFQYSKLLKYVKSNFNKNINNLEGHNILYSVQSLTMMECNISEISQYYFREFEDTIVDMKELILSRNRLKKIQLSTFWGFRRLQVFLLDHNELTTLSDGFFKDFWELKHLDLSFNNLVTLSMEVFNLKSLTRFDLQFNNIETFHNSSFIKSKLVNSIQNLNLSNNCLNSRNVNNLMNICQSDFKIVDLSYNSLTNIPSLNSDFISYNFRYNAIRNITLPQHLYQKYISPHSLGMKKILLCPNPLEMVCINGSCQKDLDNILSTFKKRNPGINVEICEDETWYVLNYFENITECPVNLKCPPSFYKSLICSDENNCTNEHLSYIRCVIVDNCPSSCSCYQNVILQQITVNCSNSYFTALPRKVPRGTNILYFENNYLEHLNFLDSSVYDNLVEIYVDNNSISTLEDLKLPDGLKKISLRNNKINSISENTQRLFTRIEAYLGGNAWTCGCSTLIFKAFLNSPNKIADIDDITCKYGQESIINISNDILCPEKVLQYLPIWAVLAIVLLIIIGILLTFYYKNKQIVFAYIYTHLPGLFKFIFKDSEVEEDKYYDAFISYSASDREVVMALIEELEEKEPKFSFCIHERDWIPGNPICSNIANSVSNSRRTIIILSEQFLNSIWFPVELHSAYYKMLEDKVNRIIFILKGNLPPINTLDKDLQVLLKTKTYLVWGERWFWEKLRLALPHNIHPRTATAKSLIEEDEFL